jgi:hypothetical protein
MGSTVNTPAPDNWDVTQDVMQMQMLTKELLPGAGAVSASKRDDFLRLLGWGLDKLNGVIEHEMGDPVDFRQLTDEQIAFAEAVHPAIEGLLERLDAFDDETLAIVGDPVYQLRRWEATLDAVATPRLREAIKHFRGQGDNNMEEWVRY